MSRQLLVSVLVGCTALTLGILTFTRSAPRVSQHDQAVERIVAAAQQSYAALPMRSWGKAANDHADAPEGVEVVESLHFSVAPSAQAEFAAARGQLLSDVAGFLQTAVLHRDLSGYKHWRESRGDRLRSLEDMDRSWFILQDWEKDFGEPCPTNLTAEQAFDRHWEEWSVKAGADSAPVAVTVSPDGLECAVAWVESIAGDRRPVLGGPLGRANWTGGRGGTARIWWTNPRSGAFLLKQYGEVLCAEVGVIFQFGNGVRYPIVTTWVFDQQDREWRLEYVCVYNWDASKPVRSMEY